VARHTFSCCRWQRRASADFWHWWLHWRGILWRQSLVVDAVCSYVASSLPSQSLVLGTVLCVVFALTAVGEWCSVERCLCCHVFAGRCSSVALAVLWQFMVLAAERCCLLVQVQILIACQFDLSFLLFAFQRSPCAGMLPVFVVACLRATSW
jgi:hypothetical protein